MIFNRDYVAFEIFDVMKLDTPCRQSRNSNRNFDALSFRLSSDARISVGKEIFDFPSNSLCYVPSNVDYERSASRDSLIVVHFKALNYHSARIEKHLPKDPEKYRRLFFEMLRVRNEKSAFKNDCAALLSKVFSELYNECKALEGNSKIREGAEYIERCCLRKDFSLSTAAERSYMSEAYFRRLFREDFGVSPKEYVENRRISHAKSLLLAGYFSIEEISDMCGYNDSKHFSAFFRERVGIPPSKFRYNYL